MVTILHPFVPSKIANARNMILIIKSAFMRCLGLEDRMRNCVMDESETLHCIVPKIYRRVRLSRVFAQSFLE